MTPVPLPVAATALCVPTGTLRRWIREGAPVAHRGRRGRGCCTLVDVSAVRAWCDSRGNQRQMLELADSFREVIAEAVFQVFKHADGPHKRALAGLAHPTWFAVANALHEHMRVLVPEIPELGPTPEKIKRFSLIFGDARSVQIRLQYPDNM